MAKKYSYTNGARRRIRRQKNSRFVIVALLVAAAIIISNRISQADASNSISGIDSKSMLIVDAPELIDQIMVNYIGMDISFNPKLHIPNYVAWELTDSEVKGDEPRTNKFFCDENVPGCPDSWDYNYSGYDRGHMAPAGDMKWDKDAMRQTFFLTNICPQAKDLNRGAWKTVEEKCRGRAAIDKSLFIICGPILADKPVEYIGDSRIAVPSRFFKVVCAPFADEPYAIGFIMPNGKVAGGAQTTATTVDEVERITGYDFFSSLPDSIENALESAVNFDRWSRML